MTQQIVMGQWSWSTEGQLATCLSAGPTERRGPTQGHRDNGWDSLWCEVVGEGVALGYLLPGQAVTNQGALSQSSQFSGS